MNLKHLNVLQVRLMNRSDLRPEQWIKKYAKKLHSLKNCVVLEQVFRF